MENILHPSIEAPHVKAHVSVFSKFIDWSKSQEKNRFGWLGAILAIHGCALTPITLFAIVFSGTNFAYYIVALLSIAVALVTNLAAMPTKVTIPVFFISVIVDLAIIALCIASGISTTAAYA